MNTIHARGLLEGGESGTGIIFNFKIEFLVKQREVRMSITLIYTTPLRFPQEVECFMVKGHTNGHGLHGNILFFPFIFDKTAPCGWHKYDPFLQKILINHTC